MEKTDEYILCLIKLDIKLVKVIDTHIHADHISGMKELQKQTDCANIMGSNSPSEVIALKSGARLFIFNVIFSLLL